MARHRSGLSGMCRSVEVASRPQSEAKSVDRARDGIDKERMSNSHRESTWQTGVFFRDGESLRRQPEAISLASACRIQGREALPEEHPPFCGSPRIIYFAQPCPIPNIPDCNAAEPPSHFLRQTRKCERRRSSRAAQLPRNQIPPDRKSVV